MSETQATETTEEVDAPALDPAEARREHIARTMDAINARENGGEGSTAAAVQRARDGGGRFATKPPEPAPEPVARPEWLKTKELDWNRLPRGVQSEIAALQAQMPQPAQTPNPYQAVFEPHAGYFQQKGIDPVQGAASLLQIYQNLENDPSGTLRWLAERYGDRVKWGELVPTQYRQQPAASDPNGTQPGQGGQQFDIANHPAVMEMQRNYAALQRAHQELARNVQNEQRLAGAQRIAEASEQYHRWANEGGTRKPHLEAVQQQMYTLLNSGQAKDFQEAYDAACWSNPKVRETLLADNAKAALEKQKADLIAAANKQKQDRLVQARRVPVNGAAPPTPDRRATMEKTMEEIRSR